MLVKPKNPYREVWNKDELSSLLGSVRRRVLPKDISIEGRTSGAIIHKIAELRNEGVIKVKFVRVWTKEEDESLIAQVEAGKNLDQIKIKGRESSAIYARIKRLKKDNPNISLKRRLSGVQIQARNRREEIKKRSLEKARFMKRLKSFLKCKGKYWPATLVSRKLHCNEDRVSRLRKTLGLKIVHQEAMKKSKVYRDHYQSILAKKRSLKEKREMDARLALAEEERKKQKIQKEKSDDLERVFRNFTSQRCTYSLKKCSRCSKYWYNCVNFFAVKTDPVYGKQLTDVCRACI